MKKKLNISSEAEMVDLGKQFAKNLKGGDIVYLNGDLGAGKTTLTKGMIKGLGIKDNIKSPTFTLVESYSAPEIEIHHFDLYRIADPEELEWMGIRDYFNDKSIVIIEWPDKGEGFLPDANIKINLSYMEDGRSIEIIES